MQNGNLRVAVFLWVPGGRLAALFGLRWGSGCGPAADDAWKLLTFTAIIWSYGDASGSVTTVREGTSSHGRYCRECQQTIEGGGQQEDAFGIACQNPDRSWEVVSQ